MRNKVDSSEDAIVLSESLGAVIEEELGEEEEVGGGVDEVVEVGEVPGFGDGRAEGTWFGDEREGRGGVDEVGEFGEEEGEGEEEEEDLCGRESVRKKEERSVSEVILGTRTRQ